MLEIKHKLTKQEMEYDTNRNKANRENNKLQNQLIDKDIEIRALKHQINDVLY